MPNKKQRMQNRANAAELNRHVLSQHVCEECGEKGAHWIVVPSTLAEILAGASEGGFWICPKFYGPDGRRIGAQEKGQ